MADDILDERVREVGRAIRWEGLTFGRGRRVFTLPARDEHLFRATIGIIMELQECGGTDVGSAVDVVCEEFPGIEATYGKSEIAKMITLILVAELVGLSSSFQQLFRKFNRKFFGGNLPDYDVRVVIDLHGFADEPVYGCHISSGLIRFQEHCIYIRISDQTLMEQILVHEMAHAATSADHGCQWRNEMVRLQETGAPVPDWELAEPGMDEQRCDDEIWDPQVRFYNAETFTGASPWRDAPVTVQEDCGAGLPRRSLSSSIRILKNPSDS